ncbi:MAG: DUF4254 domain-containing protein [Planctomycetota bacterium]
MTIPSVDQITAMQHETVVRWHSQPIDNPYAGFLALACAQHAFNFQLWHEEDIARSPDVGDSRIAQVKRAIDRFNQQRNDGIEKLDDFLTEELARQSVPTPSEAPQNTETPGSAIDRLSIMSLRIYHMREQTERADVSAEHLESVRHKLALCQLQHADLSCSLKELLADLLAGRKRHRTYRQFKMYNDPALNPYLYQVRGR